MADYYSILGVSKKATDKQIKKAFRKLTKKHHPDVSKDKDDVKFKEISNAYEVLSDPKRRSYYDRFGTDPKDKSKPKPKPKPNFGFNIFTTRPKVQKRADNIQYILELNLKDILEAHTKTITIDRYEDCYSCLGSGATELVACELCGGSGMEGATHSPFLFMQSTCRKCRGLGTIPKGECQECQGTGYSNPQEEKVKVNIPKGVEHGMQIRVDGRGHIGKGKRNGDLYVVISIEEHEFFARDKKTLYCVVPVLYTQLISGGTLLVPSIDGKKIKFKVPPGATIGDQFKVKGFGVPVFRSEDRGDLIINLELFIPKDPNKEYLDLLKKMEDDISDEYLNRFKFK